MTETLMTEAAAQTTEGQASSTSTGVPVDGSTQGTGAPATGVENQQAAGSAAESKTDAKPEDSSQGNSDKTEDGKSDDSKGPEGAPEEYADFTYPEGIEVPQDLSDEIKSVSKELNLTQEQAQKLADLAANRTQLTTTSQQEAIKQIQASWAESTKADKELGGQALNENLAVAKKALDQFGTPELRTLLNESGLGNHPEIIRAFYKAGKAISEDRFVPPGNAANKQGSRDHASALYPTQ